MVTPKIIEKACKIVKRDADGISSYHWESGKIQEFVNKPRVSLQPKRAPTNKSKSSAKLSSVKDTWQTYSVKYLGIARGQIGILSKRLPIPRRSQVGKFLVPQMPFEDEGPRPEDYDEQVVHTYSRPNGLIPVKKRTTDNPCLLYTSDAADE